MTQFNHTFLVDAPLEAVTAFHHDTRVLKQLTPFPIFVQVHHYEPLADGSRAEFTLWFGPLPVRWVAVHSQVSDRGFTDTQVSGPLKSWRHTHTFVPVSDTQTRVNDHIVYEHAGGWRGLLSRLLFARPALRLLFTARAFLTRRGVGRYLAREAAPNAR